MAIRPNQAAPRCSAPADGTRPQGPDTESDAKDGKGPAEDSDRESAVDPRDTFRPPALLAALFSGSHQGLRPAGSLLIGMLGIAAFAVVSAWAAGSYLHGSTGGNEPAASEWIDAFAAHFAYVPLACAYVSVLLALHLIASCWLPLTVRLALIYAILYLSLAAVMGQYRQPVDATHVLLVTPLCLGSVVMRRYAGWQTVNWNRRPTPPGKLSIATLLDATAAIALTLCLAGLSRKQLPWAAFLCAVPGSALLALVGMPVWARLTAIAGDSRDVAGGTAFWTAGNLLLGCLVWLTLAVLPEHPIDGVRGSAGVLLLTATAHLWTEIPIRWLRGCGWTMDRVAAPDVVSVNRGG